MQKILQSVLCGEFMRLVMIGAAAASLGDATARADWRQFRGPDANGHVEAKSLPVEWSVEDGKNIAWTADLPGRGPSGPVVVGDRVFVTCSSGHKQDRLHVLAFDAASGAKLWERQFWATGRSLCHPDSANAAPTPTSDGERIFAFFSSCDLICLDLDGDLQWLRGLALDFPKAGNDVGMSSSPVVAGDVVVVQVECMGDSFVMGVDREVGATRWTLMRDKEPNWSSPTVLRDGANGEELVFLQSRSGCSAHKPSTGSAVWKTKIASGSISSACPSGDTVLIPASGLTAIQPRENGEPPKVIWQENRLSSGAASPIVHDGVVYTVNRAGVLVSADAATGEVGWRLRLKGAFWSTPIAADNHLYAASDDGVVHVISLGEKGEVAATNDFGEKIQASPAVDGDALYYRSDGRLWKISNSG